MGTPRIYASQLTQLACTRMINFKETLQLFEYIISRPQSKSKRKSLRLSQNLWFMVREETKETTLERADFTLQLSMFVTEEKETEMFLIIFLSICCQLLSPRF